MPRNVYCDQCEEEIGDEKLAYFSDVEKDLDFCSEECCSEWNTENNWKIWQENIHQNFISELHKIWKDEKFSYQECKEWIKIGLKPNDANFAYWLKNVKKVDAEWVKNKGYTFKKNRKNYDRLREEYNKGQSWLDQNYPKEVRNHIKEIYIDEQLEGELNFSRGCGLYLLKVHISSLVDESQFQMQIQSNYSRFTKIFKCVSAQEWIDEYYPLEGFCKRKKKDLQGNYYEHEDYGKTRDQITKLDISHENLEGSLKLISFVNLEMFNCCNNKLTKLILPQLEKTESLWCSHNYLSDLEFVTSLNPQTLVELDVSSNNFFEQNLTTFSKMINLKELKLGNNFTYYDQTRVWKGIYNHFVGSLVPLQNLTKLKWLNIDNTDLDNGVEYLPDSLNGTDQYGKQKTSYSTQERPYSKVQEIEWKLELLENKYWRKWLGLTWKEIEQWKEVGLSIYESDLAVYLQKQKGLNLQIIGSGNLNELRKEYYQINNFRLSPEIIEMIKDFKYNGLTIKQESLIDELISNEKIKEGYKKHGLCSECKQPKIIYNWCQTCSSQLFQEEFKNWTSRDSEIDKFIQKHQLEATEMGKLLEWIPYEQFTNIKFLAEGGFSKVYKAWWINGPIASIKNKKWERRKDWEKDYKEVVLKNLKDSSNLMTEFLQEITKYKLLNTSLKHYQGIVECYGISWDPVTKNYVMIMDYKSEGNLRQYLQANYSKLRFYKKFGYLSQIIDGLKQIHDQGLMHKDFHAGNILNDEKDAQIGCFITDLGLCKPAGEKNNDKFYGVLPYVAPEVLRGKPYTQASDIYSFGMIMYEILSGLPPYVVWDEKTIVTEIPHDLCLVLKICRGLRPNLDYIKLPQTCKDTIKRCWDAYPEKRPTVSELEEILSQWQTGIRRYNRDTEFYQQVEEADNFNKMLLSTASVPIYQNHLRAVYTSRPLNFKNLPEPQNSKEINEIFYKLTEELEDLQITDPAKFSEELEKRFNNLQLQEKSQEILLESEEIPPIEIPSQPANLTILHLNYQWASQDFTPQQTQDWLSAGLQPTDHHFAAYLRDHQHLTPETALNQADYNQLKEEYRVYQEQLQSHQEQPPK